MSSRLAIYWLFSWILLTIVTLTVTMTEVPVAPETANLNPFPDDFTTTSLLYKGSKLFITSFKFTYGSQLPSFVDYVFGSQALVYSQDLDRYHHQRITAEEIKVVKAEFARRFRLSARQKAPACSVTMIGFFDNSAFNSSALISSNRSQVVGLAQLTTKKAHHIINNNNNNVAASRWRCFYRDMNRNEFDGNNSMVSMMFYCPSQSMSNCEGLHDPSTATAAAAMKAGSNGSSRKHFSVVKARLVMPALIPQDPQIRSSFAASNWSMSFRARVYRPDPPSHTSHTSHTSYTSHNTPVKGKSISGVAVCAVIPYLSHYPEKVAVNGAILFEWIHHYVRLGFQIHLYDQWGSHRDVLTSYARSQSVNNNNHNLSLSLLMERGHLIYHDYTIRSLMTAATAANNNNNEGDEVVEEAVGGFKAKQVLQFDNSVYPAGEDVRVYVDFDKTWTYSHCRHELSAIWGIEDVLVVDHDEFLFCPGPPTKVENKQPKKEELQSYSLQSDRLSRFVQASREKQLLFGYLRKFAVRNATVEAPLNCTSHALRNNQSIFTCYGDFDTSFPNGFYKSFHFGHRCPNTYPHEASIVHRAPRLQSCGQVNYEVFWRRSADCALIHLSLLPHLLWGQRSQPPAREVVQASELLQLRWS